MDLENESNDIICLICLCDIENDDGWQCSICNRIVAHKDPCISIWFKKNRSCPQCRHENPPTIISNDESSSCVRQNAKERLIKNAPFCSCLYIISFVLINLKYIYNPLMWSGIFVSNFTTLFLMHTVFDIRKCQ